MAASVTVPMANNGAAVSAVRVIGCLSIVLGIGLALIGWLSGGIAGLAIGACVAIVGIVMASVKAR